MSTTKPKERHQNGNLLLRSLDFKNDYIGLIDLYDEVFENELSALGSSASDVLREMKAALPFMNFLGKFNKKYRHTIDGFVFTHNDEIIAATTVSTIDMKNWEIAMVATHPQYRKRGLGRQLVSAALEYAKNMEAEIAYLEVIHNSTPAYNLYSSLGFVHYDTMAKYSCGIDKIPKRRSIEIPTGYEVRVLNRSKKTSKERYDLTVNSTPQLVKEFMRIDPDKYKDNLIKKIIRPILLRIMRIQFLTKLIYFNNKLIASVFVTIKKSKSGAHAIDIQIDHEHHENISHYLIDVAIQEILDKGVQLNKILITARVADKRIIEAITDYNFEEIEKIHCLGLKF